MDFQIGTVSINAFLKGADISNFMSGLGFTIISTGGDSVLASGFPPMATAFTLCFPSNILSHSKQKESIVDEPRNLC